MRKFFLSFTLTKILQFILILSFNISFCQEILVKDNITSEPVAYATVQIFLESKIIGGDYTNIEGLVTINKKLKYDEVRISCIGYKSRSILKNKINRVIILEAINITLDEILINKKSFDNYVFTNLLNLKPKSTMGFGRGYEVGLFIKNNDTVEKKINSVVLQLKNGTEAGFLINVRVHFYKEANGLPVAEVTNDNSIYTLKTTKGKNIEIDISKLNLKLPKEGLFVCIENLGIPNMPKSSGLTEVFIFNMSYSKNKPLTVLKSIFNNNVFYNFSQLFGSSKKVTKNSKKQYNISLGLKLEVG